ncbi:MAG: 23S rRNA (pseudouridine(1915)-N(3))-methyltransferase RlmH [Terriglobales bacterium]
MGGLRLGLIWMGKTKSPLLRAATAEAVARLQAFARFATLATAELAGRDPAQQLLQRASGTRLWLCDPAGRAFTSPQFAAFLQREASAHPSREILFAIAGADGFPPAVVSAAAGHISLSPLTFSHELARLVALEQLYRACAMLTGHPYPH